MKNKDTLLISAGRRPYQNAGMVNPPIYQTSTVLFPTLQEYHQAEKGNSCYHELHGSSNTDPSYGIAGTPTTFALKEALTILEQGDDCVLTSSGLSAITHALLAFLRSGDHLLICDSVYGPTRRFCNKELKKFGIEVTYYDPKIGAEIANLVQNNTKIIFLESPGSQTFEVQDVPAIVSVARAKNIVTILDNSWATPLYFNPLAIGVDVSIQAVTKYLNGHGDVLMGAIITKGRNVANTILREYKNSGGCVSPADCALVLRGLRTLSPRMERHSKSAEKIIKYIKNVRQIETLLYPADVDSPDYELWKSQFSGAASLFSVVLDKKYDYEKICNFVNSLQIFSIGASWGGYESLVLDFDPGLSRTATKWTEKGSCLRFYIGLENADDLIADLRQAFVSL